MAAFRTIYKLDPAFMRAELERLQAAVATRSHRQQENVSPDTKPVSPDTKPMSQLS